MSFVARAAALVKPWLFSVVLAIGLLAPQQAPADGIQRPFNRIVVFGDSLSDPGNAFALTGQTVVPPDYGMDEALELITLVPQAPYASHRFSNGSTWIELLGGAIGLGSSVKPVHLLGQPFGGLASGASNFAVGGAKAGGTGPFDLSGQVNAFLCPPPSQSCNSAPADALYVIAIGGNDVRSALDAALDTDPDTDPVEVIGAAVQSLAQNIIRLHGEGARKFLLWNVPNLGGTPAIQRLDSALCPVPFPGPGCIANGATGLAAGYNAALMGALQDLGGLPEIEIVPFDAFGSLEAIQARPRRFGLSDATTACIRPNVPPLFRCAQPDRHFFWDGIHPTRAGHAIIAFLAGKALVAAALQDD